MGVALFYKYGGFDTVHEIVGDFYQDVLDRENLGQVFIVSQAGPRTCLEQEAISSTSALKTSSAHKSATCGEAIS